MSLGPGDEGRDASSDLFFLSKASSEIIVDILLDDWDKIFNDLVENCEDYDD